MYERFTDRARKVMQLANQEAQRFNHEYIGTEHILLGLVKEGSGVAANVLEHRGGSAQPVSRVVKSSVEEVHSGSRRRKNGRTRSRPIRDEACHFP